MVSIRYIGHRDPYIEGAYGSRIIFRPGEAQRVPDDLAYKLLRHSDVYIKAEQVDAPDAVIAEQKPVDPEEENLQIYRDTIANLDKESLETFAQTHFRVKLDGRKSVDNLRNEVIQLVDQYGII